MCRVKFYWLLSLIFIFWGTLSGPVSVKAADTIKIGVILPLTGEKANFGEIEWNSFKMALDEINKTGIKGKKIELLPEDDT